MWSWQPIAPPTAAPETIAPAPASAAATGVAPALTHALSAAPAAANAAGVAPSLTAGGVSIAPAPATAAASAIAPLLHTSGYGAAGAATFAMSVEAGASVTYEWLTDVMESISGLEQRASCRARPRESYSFSALLTDAQHRAALSLLARHAHEAPVFRLALAYEDASIVSSTSTTITVHSLALCDWTTPGQRVAVVSPSGEVGEATVQGSAGATLVIDADLTAVAVEGARIMPTVAVYLDADQGLARQKIGMGRWDLAARAVAAPFPSGGAVGTGASVTTFDGLPVWELGVAKQLAEQPLFTGAQLADLGGVLSSLPAYTRSAWGRAMRIHGARSRGRTHWQYFKAFLHTIQGRRRAFLLPTGRPDLVPVGDASSGTLTVVGPPAASAPDYVNAWFPSLAHRRLRLVLADGTAAYREVVSCSASSGTQDLVLASPLAGALARVEFLEQVRLENDTVTVTFDGPAFSASMSARVVQR